MTELVITLDHETARRLSERAKAEGVSAEALAAEAVAEMVSDDGPWPPLLTMSNDEFRASIEEQRRRIAEGTAVLMPHEQVVADVRTKLAKARDRKS